MSHKRGTLTNEDIKKYYGEPPITPKIGKREVENKGIDEDRLLYEDRLVESMGDVESTSYEILKEVSIGYSKVKNGETRRYDSMVGSTKVIVYKISTQNLIRVDIRGV